MYKYVFPLEVQVIFETMLLKQKKMCISQSLMTSSACSCIVALEHFVFLSKEKKTMAGWSVLLI